MILPPSMTIPLPRAAGPVAEKSHSAVSSRLWDVAAELIAQKFRRRAGVCQTLAGELADGLEMETVLETRLPIAVGLALLVAFGDLMHAISLAAELDGAVDETDHAEVVEVER